VRVGEGNGAAPTKGGRGDGGRRRSGETTVATKQTRGDGSR